MFKTAFEMIWNPWGAAATAAAVIVGMRALRAAAKVAVSAGLKIQAEADSIVEEAKSELEESKRAELNAAKRRSTASHIH